MEIGKARIARKVYSDIPLEQMVSPIIVYHKHDKYFCIWWGQCETLIKPEGDYPGGFYSMFKVIGRYENSRS